MAIKRRISIHKVNLLLDIGIGIAFIVEEQIHWTGIRNHELLGLAFGLALLVHIALHWRWARADSHWATRRDPLEVDSGQY